MRPVEPDVNPQPRAAIRRARRARARAGFTIVEIMTVIAIILILVGMAAIAYKTLNNPSAGSSTKVTLNNLQGQLAEYEATAGLRNQPATFVRGGSPVNVAKANPPINIWQEEVFMKPLPDSDVSQNGNVSTGASARYAWDPIPNTQRVYQILARVPANKQSVQKLPSRQVLGRVDETPTRDNLLHPLVNGKVGDVDQLDPPLILDAWGNPIIFVGSRGLVGVYVGKKPHTDGTQGTDYDPPRSQRVTSVGTFDTKAAALLPAGARPFFASAGPDGNFRTGDDNVYSFNP